MHMAFMFKQCTQHQGLNNTDRCLTSVSIPYKPMKWKFCMNIIAKSWPMKFVMIIIHISSLTNLKEDPQLHVDLWYLLPIIYNTYKPFVTKVYHLHQHYHPCKPQISCLFFDCCLLVVTTILWHNAFSTPITSI
jgi:hypothetical protein